LAIASAAFFATSSAEGSDILRRRLPQGADEGTIWLRRKEELLCRSGVRTMRRQFVASSPTLQSALSLICVTEQAICEARFMRMAGSDPGSAP
jgi:hypothetical protein